MQQEINTEEMMELDENSWQEFVVSDYEPEFPDIPSANSQAHTPSQIDIIFNVCPLRALTNLQDKYASKLRVIEEVDISLEESEYTVPVMFRNENERSSEILGHPLQQRILQLPNSGYARKQQLEKNLRYSIYQWGALFAKEGLEIRQSEDLSDIAIKIFTSIQRDSDHNYHVRHRHGQSTCLRVVTPISLHLIGTDPRNDLQLRCLDSLRTKIPRRTVYFWLADEGLSDFSKKIIANFVSVNSYLSSARAVQKQDCPGAKTRYELKGTMKTKFLGCSIKKLQDHLKSQNQLNQAEKGNQVQIAHNHLERDIARYSRVFKQ